MAEAGFWVRGLFGHRTDLQSRAEITFPASLGNASAIKREHRDTKLFATVPVQLHGGWIAEGIRCAVGHSMGTVLKCSLKA